MFKSITRLALTVAANIKKHLKVANTPAVTETPCAYKGPRVPLRRYRRFVPSPVSIAMPRFKSAAKRVKGKRDASLKSRANRRKAAR